MMNSITTYNRKLREIAEYLQDGSSTANQEKTAKGLESLHDALYITTTTSSNFSENCVSAYQLGATPELLLSIIGRHSTSAKIYKLGFELMATMEYHTDLVCTKDLIELARLGMNHFCGDPKVAVVPSTTTSIFERAIISNGDDISATQVGLLAILSAMKDNPTQLSIQRNACIVLYRLIENKDDYGTAMTVVKEGGIDLVIAAMQNERFCDTDLLENGCRFLSKLVHWGLEGHGRLIIEAGGLEALSKVVRIYKFRNEPRYEHVAEMASKTMVELATL